jgi:membrane fusion protein, multidrug efflux system
MHTNSRGPSRAKALPSRSRIRPYLSLIALCSAVVVLSSCVPGGLRRGTATRTDEPVIAVEAGAIVPAGIREVITVNGEVEAVSSVDVFPSAGGELTEILVGVGDRVRRDQIIARVDPSRPGQVFTPSPVRAPISGTITRMQARIGAQVSAQTPVARISTTNDLQLVTVVPERFIQHVAVGQMATVRFDAYPDRDYEARVARLAPVVDPQSRTLETTLNFTSVDERIRPGLFARIELVLSDQPDALTIPQAALVRRDGRTYVYVVGDDDRAEMREVTTGIEADGRVELRLGVSEGDRVVTRGQNLLEDGAPVRVVGAAAQGQ